MSEDYMRELPSHLRDLLNPTPSGTAKLLAAWDGLAMESQMQVLISLDETEHQDYLIKKVLDKALDSPNAYIRYLAATKIPWLMIGDEEEKILKERLKADVDPLVKYCVSESDHIDNPQSFFNLPQEARLAQVRQLGIGNGEKIASLITYAMENLIKHGEVSEIEVEEILTDYLVRPAFKKRYEQDYLQHDGYAAYRAGNEINALWNLVPKVPEKTSYVLLTHLPEQVGLNEGIPQAVLEQLTSNQLFTLLYRPDIELSEFRKQIFNKPAEHSDADEFLIRSGAISCNFSLTYEEFSNILKKPAKDKNTILTELANSAGDLRLVFYQALYDILSEDTEDAENAKITLERKIKRLEEWEKEYQLTELKLYKLAKDAVPWVKDQDGYFPKNQLEFLAPLIVPGDTWQTFMNFSEGWKKCNTEKVHKLLPFIPAIEKK
ncbi:MAG: hypothetical protein OEZ41_05940 [Nitrospirota bacterium]|nr:hypothetical protein [Nitrospirota bacterium]MDH5699488.1 hypothetical protein [Nitrospirota bacterium]